MAETVNIGEIANQISEDIFSHFGWKAHALRDVNFECTNQNHVIKTKATGKKAATLRKKDTRPGDVVFYYDDPYLGKTVYLHTDLKSYSRTSIGPQKLRSAIESLAMTVECAKNSHIWREKYSTPDTDFEVRGMLFVYNHDNKYQDDFDTHISSTDLGTIPIAPNIYIHLLGPHDINRLYSITNDIMRLQQQRLLPENYTCYYPDQVLWHRKGDVYSQPATIESLTAPYFVITFEKGDKLPPGFLIYYNRNGESADEFEYFLDSLSRWQLLEPGKDIRIRIASKNPDPNFRSKFQSAKQRYAKAWGFDATRLQLLDNIVIDKVTSMTSTYSPDDIGWRDER